jgi:hypothetical protein
VTLADLLAVYRGRFHLPDPGLVEVVLAAWVANFLPDDAVLLLVVGPPSSGKSEVVSSLRTLAHAHLASDLSVAGLLTLGGRNDDDNPRTAGRGLLRDIGAFGVILAPELSTLIAEGRREDSKVFGALREIATDGRYSRQIGGRTLTWEGKAGFIGCVTEAVDELGMGALGERFLYYRVPLADEDDDLASGVLALSPHRTSSREVQDATRAFVTGLTVSDVVPALDDEDQGRLSRLATFVARCRSTVTWDTRHADAVVDVPQPERSPRLLRGCAQLLRALRVLGCDETEAWRVVRQVALGSIRTRKRRVLGALLGATGPMATSGIAGRARLPETGVRRDLAEMDAFGIVHKVGDQPPRWLVSETYRAWWTDLVALGGAVDLATLQHLTIVPDATGRSVDEGDEDEYSENVGSWARTRDGLW